jgi:hypothetical protein
MDLILDKPHKSLPAGFRWTDIPSFAVLTGANGAGKSQVLEALQAHMLRSEALAAAGGDPKRVGGPPPTWVVSLIPTAGVTLNVAQAFASDLNLVLQSVDTLFKRERTLQIDRHLAGEAPDSEPPPWDTLHSILRRFNAAVRFSTPATANVNALNAFSTELIGTTSGARLKPSDLSPGEQMLVKLAVWTWHVMPIPDYEAKLLLLDEPDAHLHTQSIPILLTLLRDEFVTRRKMTVVLATHRPDTIALAPAGSIFELYGPPPSIRSVSNAGAIASLSAHLFAAAPSTRCVLVEDADDARFYEGMYRRATKAADWPAGPRLVFQSAGYGEGSSKVPGGKKPVAAWVAKLASAELFPFVQGIRDRDAGNDLPTATGVHVLSRYAIENYVCDPIAVYASLIQAGQEGNISVTLSRSISRGEQRSLLSLPNAELQAIADAVCAAVVPHLGPLASGEDILEPVSFVDGRTLLYPRWLLNRNGHALEGSFFAAFGKAGSKKDLTLALEMAPLISKDIADLFQRIMAMTA